MQAHPVSESPTTHTKHNHETCRHVTNISSELIDRVNAVSLMVKGGVQGSLNNKRDVCGVNDHHNGVTSNEQTDLEKGTPGPTAAPASQGVYDSGGSL